MQSRLGELARLVESAKKQGARGTEVLYQATSGVQIRVQRGRAVAEEPIESASLTVRCWLEGGREGEAQGAPREGGQLLERALTAAAAAPEDELAGPVARMQAVLGGLSIDDRRHGSVTRKDRLDVAVSSERSIRQVDRRLAPEDFRYQDFRRQRTYVNSKNVALEEFDTVYEASGAVSAVYDGQELRLFGGSEARTFASIASVPFGTLLARRAAALMQKGETLEGDVPVMLPPLVVARLFGRLAEGFAGVQPDFFLAPGKGASLDPRIHLLDDGRAPGGFRTRSFDDRGVAPVPLALIREGRPDARLLDPRTARSLQAQPTGHVSADRLVPSNLILRTGTRSMNAIQLERDTWMFVVDDLLPAAVDLATGELDASVNGLVLKSNEVRGAMRGVRLRGNLLTVFNRLEELTSDTDRYGHIDAPGMLVGGLTLG